MKVSCPPVNQNLFPPNPFIGGAPVKTWVIRACAVQGIQQIYISGLWYWGSLLSSYDSNGIPSARASGVVISAVCLPLAALLIALSFLTFFGLPNYYRQTPGSIPSFFKSVFRRKLIIVSDILCTVLRLDRPG